MSGDLSRRTLLGAGAAVPAVGLLGRGQPAEARRRTSPADRLDALERQHGARLGVYAVNARTGATLTHRADERFAFCSTFKTLAAAAVLRDLDSDGEFLARLIPYTAKDLVTYSPITQNHVGAGMRVDELCAAALDYSDNSAGNLLLRQIGGPAGLTRFCRSLGDQVTRSDRWETDLNTNLPGDPRDTSTPRAFGTTYRALLLGDALTPADRQRLTGWLMGNTTSAKRFRAGLPAGWLLADKTGTGDYGAANDAGVAWTTHGTPILLTVLSSKGTTKDTPGDDALVADAARIAAAALAPHE